MSVSSYDGRKNPGGRPFGSQNADRVELRSLLQEKVSEFTALQRERQIADGVPPEQAQEHIEEYDPVIALALVAVDQRSTLEQRIKCNSEVAQYVRPKLKSVEYSGSAVDPDEARLRQEQGESFISLLNKLAGDKKSATTSTE